MEGLEEFALPEEKPPAARPPGGGPHRRREERPEAPPAAQVAPEEGDDLLASLDLGESLELEAAPAAREAASPPGGGAAASPDAVSEEDLLSFEVSEAPSPAPSRAAPVEVKGVAGEEDKELGRLFALDTEEESPAAAAGARTAPAAPPGDEELLSLLDEADEAAPAAPFKEPPRAGAPREESMEDFLLEETEAGKEVSAAGPAPVPSAQGKAAGKGEGEDDASSLWADAFTEEQPAPPAAASKGLLDEEAVEAGAREGDGPSAAWADALGEEEGAPAARKKEVTPPVGASAGSGEDSLSDMWSEAFAEQEAAARAQRGEEEPQAGPRAAAAGEFGEGDLERMWSDALNETGDAPAPRAAAAAAPLPDAEEGLSKEDLAGFLDEAEKGPAPSVAAPAGGEAAPPAEEEEAAPRPPGGGGFGLEEDSGEIEAYVPEEAPVAAAAVAEAEPKAGGGDFLADAGAPPEEPEKEEQAEIIGVPLAARIIAGAVDFAVLATLQGLFAGVSFGIVSKAAGPVSSNVEALILLGVLNLAVLFLLSIFYSVYFVGMFGSTPGQRSMGLSVVDMDDKPVEYMQAVLRYFGGVVACLPLGLGHLLILFDEGRRGLGDRLAGTHVVLKVKV
jgi:uncharacterized RDD family membrane protein YckC